MVHVIFIPQLLLGYTLILDTTVGIVKSTAHQDNVPTLSAVRLHIEEGKVLGWPPSTACHEPYNCNKGTCDIKHLHTVLVSLYYILFIYYLLWLSVDRFYPCQGYLIGTGQSYDCTSALLWRHNEGDGISNHRCFDCLNNRLFSHRWIKENIKAPHHWSLWEEFSGFPSQRASNPENVSTWWRHHGQWNKTEWYGWTNRMNPTYNRNKAKQIKIMCMIYGNTSYRWFSARLQELHCVSNGVPAVLR